MPRQIYRCFIVWGFQWSVLVVPVTMLIGTTSKQIYLTYKILLTPVLVCGYRSVYNFSQGANLTASTTAWGDATFILSLLTNLLVTTMIGQTLEFRPLLV